MLQNVYRATSDLLLQNTFSVKMIDTFTYNEQYYSVQELLDCDIRHLYKNTLGYGFSLCVIQKFTFDLLK